jgi:hypothetical protein
MGLLPAAPLLFSAPTHSTAIPRDCRCPPRLLAQLLSLRLPGLPHCSPPSFPMLKCRHVNPAVSLVGPDQPAMPQDGKMNIYPILRHFLAASRTPHDDPPNHFRFKRHQVPTVPAVFSYRIFAPDISALQECCPVSAFRRLPSSHQPCSGIERWPLPSSGGPR